MVWKLELMGLEPRMGLPGWSRVLELSVNMAMIVSDWRVELLSGTRRKEEA
jgi:hypothetical protein